MFTQYRVHSLFICAFLLVAQFLTAQLPNPIRVITHDKITVVTDPASGSKSYFGWGIFPSTSTPIRKINMRVLFGCPDSVRCADWDYMDQLVIRRKGGSGQPDLQYEIGRMLTPYGGAFAKNWNFEWETDVTDFSLLLRDSVEIEYRHPGYEPNNDRGWKITVQFDLHPGPPALTPIAFHRIYDGHYTYGYAGNPIEQQLRPVTVKADNRTKIGKILLYQTGHGMDPAGCGEFCSRYREIFHNGTLVDKRNLWQECGDNPLYPQAGTWLIDRAYWCPGELKHADKFERPVKPGTEQTIQVKMEPYTSSKPSATEVLSTYFVEYGAYRAAHDVAVDDILAPSSKPIHSRLNPAGFSPLIAIRNLGGQVLTSVIIRYGTKGFQMQSFAWKGNLPPGAAAMVRLPGVIEHKGSEEQEFTVELANPNGKKDGYLPDNKLISRFTPAPVHATNLMLQLKTNRQPQHNGYTLKDAQGKILYEKPVGSLQADSLYEERFTLPPGHYELLIEDTAHDGLEFWFNRRGGRGYARLLDSSRQLIKTFESDFGTSLLYHFEVSAAADEHSAPSGEPAIGLYPTMSSGPTTLDFFNNTAEKVIVRFISDPGNQLVEEHTYENLKEAVLSYDMSYLPAQRYYVQVFVKGKQVFNKRLRIVQRNN